MNFGACDLRRAQRERRRRSRNRARVSTRGRRRKTSQIEKNREVPSPFFPSRARFFFRDSGRRCLDRGGGAPPRLGPSARPQLRRAETGARPEAEAERRRRWATTMMTNLPTARHGTPRLSRRSMAPPLPANRKVATRRVREGRKRGVDCRNWCP